MIPHLNKYVCCAFLTLFIVITKNVKSQNFEKYYSQNTDKFLVEIPLWMPFFNGQISYGNYSISTGANKDEREFNRLHNHFGLEFYFVGRFTYKKNKLWLNFDTFAGRINKAVSVQWVTTTPQKEIINLNVQTTLPRLVAGYSVWKPIKKEHFVFEVIPYAGFRYVTMTLKTDVFDNNQLIHINPHWLEPVVGIYLPLIYKRIKAEVQLDYGGNSNKNTWVFGNRYRYRISKLVDVQLGLNFFQLKYQDTYNEKAIETKVQLLGPTIGVGVRF